MSRPACFQNARLAMKPPSRFQTATSISIQIARPRYQPRHEGRVLSCRSQAQAKGFGAQGKTTARKPTSCTCGSGLPYRECCQPYHLGRELAPTAEALMRSRYSAYTKGLVDYIVETTHPENPLADGGASPAGTTRETLQADVKATCEKIAWEKLKVLGGEDGASPDEAFVTFQTWFKVRGQMGQRAQGWVTQSFVERSRFLRDESGRWLYVDGEQDWKR
jgi:SEC-C motif domain protein